MLSPLDGAADCSACVCNQHYACVFKHYKYLPNYITSLYVIVFE